MRKKIFSIFLFLLVIGAIIFFGFAPGYIDRSKNIVALKMPVLVEKQNWYDSIPFIADMHCDALL
jgi:membrane dipeptidase